MRLTVITIAAATVQCGSSRMVSEHKNVPHFFYRIFYEACMMADYFLQLLMSPATDTLCATRPPASAAVGATIHILFVRSPLFANSVISLCVLWFRFTVVQGSRLGVFANSDFVPTDKFTGSPSLLCLFSLVPPSFGGVFFCFGLWVIGRSFHTYLGSLYCTSNCCIFLCSE